MGKREGGETDMNELVRAKEFRVNDSRTILIDAMSQWGIIIPEPTGVFYHLQTGGVCCHHPAIEGIFLPLKWPIKIIYHKKSKKKLTKTMKAVDFTRRDLLGEIAIANYDYKHKRVEELWKEVKEELKMDWEDSKECFGEEGYKFIKITKVPLEDYWCMDLRQLLGEEVVLIYPNSD